MHQRRSTKSVNRGTLICGVVATLLVVVSPGRAADSEAGPMAWSTLPSLPSELGFAGMYVGVSHDALVVAGGANFPDGAPWDGGTKTWWGDAYVLTDAGGTWQQVSAALPGPCAYGASVTWEDQVICIGGNDAERCYADVFALEWDAATQALRLEQLPPLPTPLAYHAAALVGSIIYVAGGQTSPDATSAVSTFYALDLAQPREQQAWRELDPLPGAGRVLPMAGAQMGRFYLFGGASLGADAERKVHRTYLRDAYAYSPDKGWETLSGLPTPLAGAPSPAAELGSRSLLILGGDDGEFADRVMELRDQHPGFRSSALMYNIVTDRWVEFPTQLTTTATTATTWWEGHWIVPSGEVRPAVRTPVVISGDVTTARSGFQWFDSLVLAVYLGGMLIIGWWCSRGGDSTHQFFLAGRRIPWWAAGLSVFGTQLSAITFLAIPAMVYRTDWVYFLANMMIIAVVPVVVLCYLPFYRRLNIVSAYEYLGLRFNGAVRTMGSAAFALFQIGRMGVVLYLPSLALATVTGYDVAVCILLMGVVATIYTGVGGIGAVIWTDVVQVIVLMGGALVSLAVLVHGVDGGLGGIITAGWQAGKFHAFNLTWDATTTAVWVVVVGRFMDNLVPYTADQTVVQRYLVTTDQRSAARALWTNAALTLPATLVFFSIGTALWAFYRTHPNLLNHAARGDDIFPWFIAQQLPVGLTGLVLAAVFAASMSSLDSSINSMATTLTIDFFKRWRPHASDRACLRFGKWLTYLLGAIGTASALYMAALNTTSMWDMMTRIMGLFGSGLAGLFALGIFTRRTHTAGAIIGFVASAVCLYFVSWYTPISFFLYSAIGISTCVIVGYLASVILPAPARDLAGLTIHSPGMRQIDSSSDPRSLGPLTAEL